MTKRIRKSVTVTVEERSDGTKKPLVIHWENKAGETIPFPIEKATCFGRRANQQIGVCGILYECTFENGKSTLLYDEGNGSWVVGAKVREDNS